jgi:hypothetical protein
MKFKKTIYFAFLLPNTKKKKTGQPLLELFIALQRMRRNTASKRGTYGGAWCSIAGRFPGLLTAMTPGMVMCHRTRPWVLRASATKRNEGERAQDFCRSQAHSELFSVRSLESRAGESPLLEPSSF